MKIAVLADDTKWNELMLTAGNAEWIRCTTEKDFFENRNADIYINLQEDAFAKDYSDIKKTGLINSVTNTLKEINANKNVLRINGWNSFLSRSNWDVAGKINEPVEQFFSAIKKTFTLVPDEPGLISARIISMIINEAYFVLEENLSTREEIDIAMKLGANYSYGPFEWCDKIGIKNVFALLQKLSVTDKRYLPALLLQKNSML
jgi:3-hydroxybutyryl-CoA dehydrogenase